MMNTLISRKIISHIYFLHDTINGDWKAPVSLSITIGTSSDDPTKETKPWERKGKYSLG